MQVHRLQMLGAEWFTYHSTCNSVRSAARAHKNLVHGQLQHWECRNTQSSCTDLFRYLKQESGASRLLSRRAMWHVLLRRNVQPVFSRPTCRTTSCSSTDAGCSQPDDGRECRMGRVRRRTPSFGPSTRDASRATSQSLCIEPPVQIV